jgi:hypothetical protein
LLFREALILYWRERKSSTNDKGKENVMRDEREREREFAMERKR